MALEKKSSWSDAALSVLPGGVRERVAQRQQSGAAGNPINPSNTPGPAPISFEYATNPTANTDQFNYLLQQFDMDMSRANPTQYVSQMRAHLSNIWNQINDPNNNDPNKHFYAQQLNIAWQATNKMLQNGYSKLTPEEKTALAVFTNNPNANAIRTALLNDLQRQQKLAQQPNPLPKKEPWYSSDKFLQSAILAFMLRLMGARF